MTTEELLALDVRAAAGDADAARLVRWAERHPHGADSVEDVVEATALLPRSA